jgi:hypothetical protein
MGEEHGKGRAWVWATGSDLDCCTFLIKYFHMVFYQGSENLKMPNPQKSGGSVKLLQTPLTPTVQRELVKPLRTDRRSVKVLLVTNLPWCSVIMPI